MQAILFSLSIPLNENKEKQEFIGISGKWEFWQWINLFDYIIAVTARYWYSTNKAQLNSDVSLLNKNPALLQGLERGSVASNVGLFSAVLVPKLRSFRWARYFAEISCSG